MLSIRSSADMDRALDGPMDPQLRRLLTLRRDQLLANVNIDLGDVAHIIVAFRSDTLATVEAEAGFSLTGSDAAVEWVGAPSVPLGRGRRHPDGRFRRRDLRARLRDH